MPQETANGQQVEVVESNDEPDPYEPEESVINNEERVEWPEEAYEGD